MAGDPVVFMDGPSIVIDATRASDEDWGFYEDLVALDSGRLTEEEFEARWPKQREGLMMSTVPPTPTTGTTT